MPDANETALAPSATVILLRAATEGFEVLLLQRANELAFHGGAWAFPGGRVDPCDRVDTDLVRCALRAGVRETREEAGVSLDAETLLPFAHWTTPAGYPRRFATWFFAAEVSSELQVTVDGCEMRDHRWLQPLDALIAHGRKQLELPPPTFVSLTLLSRFTRLSEVLAHLRNTAPMSFVPRPHQVAGGVVSLYAGDAAYEQGDVEQSGPRHRLWMLESGWRYECSLERV